MKVFLVIAGVVLAAVATFAAFMWLGGTTEAQPWDTVEPLDGTTVRVSYGTGTCNHSEDLEVEETPDSVTITVVVVIKASSCNDMGVQHELETDLDQPLGNREVIDGACTYDPPATYGKCR